MWWWNSRWASLKEKISEEANVALVALMASLSNSMNDVKLTVATLGENLAAKMAEVTERIEMKMDCENLEAKMERGFESEAAQNGSRL